MQQKARKRKKLQNDYYPRILVDTPAYPWLMIVMVMFLGAAVGFLISLFVKPVYEAKALISTNIALVQSDAITEIMVDAEINHIGELVFHQDVITDLIQSEATFGNRITLEDLKKQAVIERQLMNNIIKVRDNNPVIAARIASSWTRILYARLTQAYGHAVILSGLTTQLDLYNSCLDTDATELSSFCSSLTPPKLTLKIQSLQNEILIESPKTLGLSSIINISQFQPAQVPEKPINSIRGGSILVGSLAGLLTGIVIGEIIPLKDDRDEV